MQKVVRETFFGLSLLFIWISFFAHAKDGSITGSGIYIGAMGDRFEWKPGSNSLDGYLFGPSVGIDYRRPNNVYAGSRFSWQWGKISNDTCSQNTQVIDWQARVGGTVGKTFLFTPYVGLGYNAIEQQKSNDLQPCVKYVYNTIYVPVGILATYHFSTKTSLGIDYQWQPQIDNWLRISGFKSIRFDLHSTSTQSIELPFQFALKMVPLLGWQYRLIPFFRTFRFGSVKVLSTGGSMIDLSKKRGYEYGLRFEIAVY